MQTMPRTARTIADELLPRHDHLPEIRVSEDHYQAAQLAYGWFARSWHTTKASLVLHDHGFDPEAAPMRRTLIEHALALAWIGDSPDEAYDAHVAAHQYEVERFAKKPGMSRAVPKETLDALLALELDGGPHAHLVHTYHLAAKYGPEGAYTGWWEETGGSHPSWRSAFPYRSGREGRQPLDEVMTVLWFGLATAGMSKLLEGNPWAETVERCKAELMEPLQEAKAAKRAEQEALEGMSPG